MTAALEQAVREAPPVLPPSSSSSSRHQLDPAFVGVLDEKAAAIFKRFSEADALFQSLPNTFAAESELVQLIDKLKTEFESKREEDERVSAECQLWQRRLSSVITHTAKASLNAETQRSVAAATAVPSTPDKITHISNAIDNATAMSDG